MKHLNEYLETEVQPINESFGVVLLACLCGACLLHFTVKGLKAIRKHAGNFWGWALGERDLGTQAASESLSVNEEEAQKIDKNDVQPMQVPDENILDKLMDVLKSDAKKKQGFYIFDELFNETPELKKLNKAPYFANYVVFLTPGSKDDEDAKPNFYGMLGFSLKYWGVIAKKGKDNTIREAASKLTKYINIFAVQTDKQYAKQGLFEVYLENMKKAVKEAHMQGLTIKCANDEVAKVFEKYGFKPIENLKGYMILTLGEKKEDDE